MADEDQTKSTNQTKAAEEPKEEKTKVAKKLEDLIAEIEKLSVLELSELVKALEEKFGVSAAAAVSAGPAANGPAAAATEEKTEFINEILSRVERQS